MSSLLNLVWFEQTIVCFQFMNLLFVVGTKTCVLGGFKEFVFFNFRLPVELGGAQSLIPLHSATASALLTSLLSLHNTSWGCLSEGVVRNLRLFSYSGLCTCDMFFGCHYILSFINSENPTCLSSIILLVRVVLSENEYAFYVGTSWLGVLIHCQSKMLLPTYHAMNGTVFLLQKRVWVMKFVLLPVFQVSWDGPACYWCLMLHLVLRGCIVLVNYTSHHAF